MPRAYAAQFRSMIVEQVRSGRRVAEVAASVGVPEATVYRWVKQERRVLVNELLDHVAVFPDHLEVMVHGLPKVNVLLSEGGLTESQNGRVGGAIHTSSTCAPWETWLIAA